MIRNYLVITLRNFLRNKNYTLINVLGLSIGITACIVIFLLIRYELAFDKFHARYDSIYRIVQSSENSSGESHEAHTPYPLADAFRNDFPEVPLVTATHYQDEVLIKTGTDKQMVEHVLFADSLFFEVFDFNVLSGNPAEDLATPGKVFLTKSLADKILKEHEHATIRIDNRLDLQVAGIVADPPASSHIRFSMIVSLPSFTGDFIGGLPIDQWTMSAGGTVYVALPSQISSKSVEDRLPGFITKYQGKEESDKKKFLLQPLKNIHFDTQYAANQGTTTADYTDLIIMGVLGLFILVIACINFVNLATALAVKKSKEIGIRKTLGAKREQLTTYFLAETLLLTLISVLISLVATEWLLTWLRPFLEKQVEMNVFSDPWLMVFLAALILITTFFSGFYPAVILSGFNPVAVLKNKLSAQGSSGGAVRKVLVLFQFTIAQALIIGTLIIADQMQYFRNKPLGFEKESVINIPMPEPKLELQEALRARLEANSDIRNISFSLGAPTSDNNFSTGYFLTEKGSTERYSIGVKPADRHYLETYGIKLKSGRWFTEADERVAHATGGGLGSNQQEGAPASYVYILNESAARRLGFNDPDDVIGKFITTGVNRINAEVVGVVEDFHVSSLHNEIEPIVLINFPFFYYDAGLKISTDNLSETLKFIEKQWSEVYPENHFEYQFLDEKLESLYRADQRMFTMFKIFAGVSIFIGCLGLYGLISFMANQKLREVGIRKVMGASVTSIVFLFSREFVKLIVIAFLIASPVAWYFMDQWLKGFAYRIDIHWVVFVISMFSTLFIALATVSYRAIRAATVNPVETLRTE